MNLIEVTLVDRGLTTGSRACSVNACVYPRWSTHSQHLHGPVVQTVLQEPCAVPYLAEIPSAARGAKMLVPYDSLPRLRFYRKLNFSFVRTR